MLFPNFHFYLSKSIGVCNKLIEKLLKQLSRNRNQFRRLGLNNCCFFSIAFQNDLFNPQTLVFSENAKCSFMFVFFEFFLNFQGLILTQIHSILHVVRVILELHLDFALHDNINKITLFIKIIPCRPCDKFRSPYYAHQYSADLLYCRTLTSEHLETTPPSSQLFFY